MRYKLFLVGKYKHLDTEDLRIIANLFNSDYLEYLNKVWQTHREGKPNISVMNLLSVALGKASVPIRKELDLDDLQECFDLMNESRYQNLS